MVDRRPGSINANGTGAGGSDSTESASLADACNAMVFRALPNFPPALPTGLLIVAMAVSTVQGGPPDEAVARASAQLRAQVMDQPVGADLSVGQLAARLNAARDVDAVIAENTRQVGGLRWVDSGTVQVRLELDADAVRGRLVELTERTPAAPVSPDELRRLLGRWRVDRFVATGTGGAPSGAAPAAAQAVNDVPAWTDDLLDASGTAPRGKSRLHTARAAEVAARAELGRQVDELRVGQGLTVRDVAARDPTVGAAVARAVARARVTRVDHAADGGVTARVSLDLRSVWRATHHVPDATAARVGAP